MNEWDKPKEVENTELAFGPSNISKYLPKWEDIPEDFRCERGEAIKWIDKVNDWFYCGLTALKVTVKQDVYPDKALRHLKAVISSWEPKHEHKVVGLAYLMSLWYDRFDYQKVKNIGSQGEP